MSEQQQLEFAFGLMEVTREEKIYDALSFALDFCLKNYGYGAYGRNNCVSADNLRRALGISKAKGKENSYMGTIFRVGFQKVGYMPSQTEGSHARIVAIWQLTRPEAVQERLKRLKAGVEAEKRSKL